MKVTKRVSPVERILEELDQLIDSDSTISEITLNEYESEQLYKYFSKELKNESDLNVLSVTAAQQNAVVMFRAYYRGVCIIGEYQE